MNAHSQSSGEASQVDVVIVGAGLAGLTAAMTLLEAPTVNSIMVLEARERVGGRTFDREIEGGQMVEAGGEYVGPTQGHICRLAEKLGVETFPAYASDEDVYVAANGEITLYDPNAVLLPPPLKRFEPIVGSLQQLSEAIVPSEPWNTPNAQLLDSQTVHTWITENFEADGAEAVEFVELFFNSAFGGRAMDVSLLFVLAQIAGFGDESNKGTLVRGISGQGGAQESRFRGGSQLIAVKLWEAIKRFITLNAPVRKIEQNGSTVTVVSDVGIWTAGHVIVTVPPPLAVEIEWQPLLPAAHDMLRRRMSLGTLAKCQAIYPEAFWKEKGLSGFALKLVGTVKEMFDNSPPEGKLGVLNGFVGGHAWRAWQGLPDQQRREAVLDEFAMAFGEQAKSPSGYFEQSWPQERWTRGCPVSALETGVTTDFLPIIAQPFGLVHWAGTETSDYWNGFMDGAVRSGERAAAEVLDRL